MPAEVEVFTDRVANIFTLFFKGVGNQVFDHRDTASTTGTGFRTFFDVVGVLASLLRDSITYLCFGNALAATDQRGIGQGFESGSCGFAFALFA